MGISTLSYAINRAAWNEKFSAWHRPPTESEEDRIERAARMIKKAINGDARLAGHDIEVFPQGSYHNNTNVRLNSDMDLCVRRGSSQLIYRLPPGSGITLADINVTPLAPGTVEATVRDFKRTLLLVLGCDVSVEWGSKALKVEAVEGSRVDADVVPAVPYWYVQEGLFPDHPQIIVGTAILTDDGRWLYNFPEQHYERGVEKNERTGRRYKRTVRILKHLKDELVLLSGDVPSFLIESLVYNCPDAAFDGEDWYTTVSTVLGWIASQTADDTRAGRLVEANGIKTLFSYDQPWTRDQAYGYATAAVARITS